MEAAAKPPSPITSTLHERRAEAGRARFREMLEQNGGTVTAEMKKLRAAYLEQEESARVLDSLTEKKGKAAAAAGSRF